MMTSSTQNIKSILLNKVPQVTIFFWIIKIMATTVGETGADFLIVNMNMGLKLTSIIMGAVLLVALFIQVKSKEYTPWLYWISVVLLSIVGTLITDYMVDDLGIALQTTTIVFSLALATTFIAWYISEKTLSIHSIYTPKRELFYWLAILFTFALGTAAGDLSSESLGLGYGVSALIYGGMIAAVTFIYYVFKISPVFAFWIAYILTRPLGASFGDLLSQETKDGGLGLGTVGTSAIFLTVILVLVSYLSISKKDTIILK